MIGYIFLNLDKILITTGDPYAHGQNVELINLMNNSKKLEQIGYNPSARYGSVGGIIESQILICGGKIGYHGLNSNYFQDGFVLFDADEKLEIKMMEKRAHHSSIVLNDLLFIGKNCLY